MLAHQASNGDAVSNRGVLREWAYKTADPELPSQIACVPTYPRGRELFLPFLRLPLSGDDHKPGTITAKIDVFNNRTVEQSNHSIVLHGDKFARASWRGEECDDE